MSTKRVKAMTNLIDENVYVELADRVVELEPGKTLKDVTVKNIENVRPYMKIIEDLQEIGSN